MATDVLAYSLEPQMGTQTTEYITAETGLGEENITPGFAKYLEKFYKRADPKDRAKCLELLTSLNIQQELNEQLQRQARCKTPGPNWRPSNNSTPVPPGGCQHVTFAPAPPLRPKTAMASVGTGRRLNRDSYQTTYEREFAGLTGPSAQEDRPMTSKGIIPSYTFFGSTTYGTDFDRKPIKHGTEFGRKPIKHVMVTEAMRTGSSSGNRRNNPHPHEAFMVWRFPAKKVPEQPGSEWSTQLTDEMMDQVIRGRCRTTYQQDYVGMPQGQKLEPKTDIPEGWRSKVPYSLDSSMRHSYQMPKQQPLLKGNTTRYGCNRIKTSAAKGTVPDTSSTQMHIKTRTTYDREFSDPVPPNASDLRDIGRRLGAETLQKYIDSTDEKEKGTLTAMLTSMKSPHGSRCGSRSGERKVRTVPEATQVYAYKPEDFKPSWLSTWTGPM